jgi:hypothetical protein
VELHPGVGARGVQRWDLSGRGERLAGGWNQHERLGHERGRRWECRRNCERRFIVLQLRRRRQPMPRGGCLRQRHLGMRLRQGRRRVPRGEHPDMPLGKPADLQQRSMELPIRIVGRRSCDGLQSRLRSLLHLCARPDNRRRVDLPRRRRQLPARSLPARESLPAKPDLHVRHPPVRLRDARLQRCVRLESLQHAELLFVPVRERAAGPGQLRVPGAVIASS